MTLHHISLFIALIAIFISLIPSFKTFYEETEKRKKLEELEERKKLEELEVRKKLEELIEKYNVPTELQNLGAVTDRYFLIERFFDRSMLLHYYWIFIRQPDGALGEKKGVLTFSTEALKAFPLAHRGLDELNYMCDAEVINALRNEDA